MATKEKTTKYHEAVGRRKRATARVRLYEGGKGEVVINEKKLDEYFPVEKQRITVKEPFETAEIDNTYTVSVHVKGSGLSAQADAIRLGISRVLVDIDESLRPALKHAGYLKRDPRVKERKKFGLKKARRAPQWSKR